MKVNVDWSVEAVLKNVGSFVVYTAFTVGAFFLTRNVVGFLLDDIHIGSFLLHRFISMLLYVFFLSVNVGNIIVSYSTLYKSQEILYLLSTPVSYTNIFVAKFLDNFFYSSTTLFVIGLSVLAGYGSYFGLPWTFYALTIFLLFIPFMLLAAVIGVLLLMMLMKLAHRVGPRLLIGGVSIAYIGSVYGFFKLTNPMKLARSVLQYYPDINRYFGFLDPPFSRFLPNHWVAESLYWMSAGDFVNALPFVGLLLGGCVLGSVVAVAVARRWYYETWLIFLVLRLQREDRKHTAGAFHLGKHSRIEPQTEVLLKKEIWQFLREPSQWIHLSVILLLIAIFVASISNLEIAEGTPFLRTVAFMVVFLFNVFLISSVALRFVYPMVSIEGKAFWKVRSAPARMKKVALVKFGLALVACLAIGGVLTGFSGPLRMSGILLTSAMANIGFVTLGLVALCFGMGSLFATYNEKNPIRVASSQGASLSFLISLLYLVFLVAVLFFPLNRYFESVVLGRTLSLTPILVSAGIIGLVSLVLAGASWIVGLRSLRRDF
jgi:ABC-2 type transport system permease protein